MRIQLLCPFCLSPVDNQECLSNAIGQCHACGGRFSLLNCPKTITLITRFKCPHCRTLLEVPQRYAGRKGACAECGRKIDIPKNKRSAANLFISDDLTLDAVVKTFHRK